MNELHSRVPLPRTSQDQYLDPAPDRERVIVGVDGSPASTEALAWAVRYALEQDGILEVVTSWPLHAPVFVHEVPGHFAESRWRAAQTQARVLDAVLEQFDRVPPLCTRLENAEAGDALVRAAAAGDLLVLGSDRTGPAEVGHPDGQDPQIAMPLTVQVQRHAPCPVLLVPLEPCRPEDGPRTRIGATSTESPDAQAAAS